MPQRKVIIHNINDYFEEASMAPDGAEVTYNLTPLEQHFFEVADKHGIFDYDPNEDYEP